MKEYKVTTCKVKDAQDIMNKLVIQGWQVISVIPNIALGYGLVITLEKDI